MHAKLRKFGNVKKLSLQSVSTHQAGGDYGHAKCGEYHQDHNSASIGARCPIGRT